MTPEMGDVAQAEIDTSVATHAALTASHGVSGEIADADDLTDHEAENAPHHSAEAVLTFIIDGGGSAIAIGNKGHLEIPFDCTITAWRITADQSGAIKIDVWRDIWGNFPPADADSLCNGHEPEIPASGQKAQDADLSDWTSVALVAGDILAFYVDSCSTITRVTLSLTVTKS